MTPRNTLRTLFLWQLIWMLCLETGFLLLFGVELRTDIQVNTTLRAQVFDIQQELSITHRTVDDLHDTLYHLLHDTCLK